MTSAFHSMKSADAISFLRAMVDGTVQPVHGMEETPPLITLSRDYGSGGEKIADHLARSLGVAVYDREILDAVSNNAGVDKYLLAQLDDKVGDLRDEWALSLLTGQNLLADNYRRHLINVVLAISRHGGIIIGRGAHIILAQRHAFRLRIVGSVEQCALRLAAEGEIDIAEAQHQTAHMNHQRSQFVWDHFRQRLNDPAAFDLILNTDRLKALEQTATWIATALPHYGWRPGDGAAVTPPPPAGD